MAFIAIIVLSVFVYALHGRVGRMETEIRSLRALVGGGDAMSASASTPMVVPQHALIEERIIAEPEPTPEPATHSPPYRPYFTVPERRSDPVVPSPSDVAPSPAALGTRTDIDFERLFGRQLPIWAGDLLLAIAGFFIVRWSIDAGLLSPTVRIMMANLFGLGLIGGAEWCLRNEERVRDSRIPQALSGAGIAVLYICSIMAHDVYGLIGAGTAFAWMALVTAGAGALAVRHGGPTAAVGLVGGLLAPVLASSSEGSVPVLSLYVAVVVGGMIALARGRNWPWLSLLALGGGFLWTLAMLAADLTGVLPAIAFAALVAGLGFAGPLGLRRHGIVRAAAFAVAAVQMGLMVARGGFQPLHWGLLALLSIGAAWLSRREDGFREAPIVASAVSLVALVAMPSPSASMVGAVLAGIVAIGGSTSVLRLRDRRATLAEVAHLGALATAWSLVPIVLLDPGRVVTCILLSTTAMLLAGLAEAVRRLGPSRADTPLQVGAVLAGMVAIHAIVPGEPFVIVAAALVTALMLAAPAWIAGMATGTVVVAVATVPALLAWMAPVAGSVTGDPLMSDELPGIASTAIGLLPLAALAMLQRLRPVEAATVLSEVDLRRPLTVVTAALAGMVLHVCYRHLVLPFDDADDFIARGYAVRTIWEVALLLGTVALRERSTTGSLTLAGLSLGHFVWYSLIVHDPLLVSQSVGAIPLLSILVPAFGSAIAALHLIGSIGDDPMRRRIAAGSMMGVMLLFALSAIRQVFHGSEFAGAPFTAHESLLLSAVSIALAASWLAKGIAARQIVWRIGSLGLMLLAVVKVFLFDASGLDGFARILSFAGLGFSLIGVGWLYSRYLPETGGSDVNATIS